MRFVFIALAFLSGWSAQSQTLAIVGKDKITVEEFNRRLDEIKKQAVNPPSKSDFLEDLVRYKIGVQEAERLKLQNDPVVKERFEQVLYNSLLEKELAGKLEKIKITEPMMKEYYKKNPELRLAHILIDVKPSASATERTASKKRAEEIYQEVRKSKRPFEELVKLYSDDLPTKEMGGDVGYQSKVTLMPTIYDAAVHMKVGQIKGLIETKFGYHIIKLLDRRTYDLADKRQIRAALYDQKRADLFDAYFAKLKKSYKIEINQGVLKSLK